MSALAISLLRVDGGTQSRAALDAETVAEYADAMADGAAFPPVVVFYDGSDYWVADGFHRVASATEAGLASLPVDVRQGDRRAAVLFSVGANDNHGLRRTNADKRRAVETLLRDEEWAGWSDREIARACGVSDRFVNGLRPTANASQLSPKRKGADGKERKMPRVKTYDVTTSKYGARTHLTLVEGAPSAGETPESTGPVKVSRRNAEYDARTKQMTEDGLPPSVIAKELGVPVRTINNVKQALGLTSVIRSPLSQLVNFAEEVSDFWRSATNNFKPQWDDATEEQRKEATDQLEEVIATSKQLIRRLNKEAKRTQ